MPSSVSSLDLALFTATRLLGEKRALQILRAAVFSDKVDTGRMGFQDRLVAEIGRRTDVLLLKQGLANPEIIEARRDSRAG